MIKTVPIECLDVSTHYHHLACAGAKNVEIFDLISHTLVYTLQLHSKKTIFILKSSRQNNRNKMRTRSDPHKRPKQHSPRNPIHLPNNHLPRPHRVNNQYSIRPPHNHHSFPRYKHPSMVSPNPHSPPNLHTRYR